MTIPFWHPLHLVVGLTVWAGWFVVLYGGLTLGCQLAPPDPAEGPMNWINLLLSVSTVVVAGVLAWVAWRCARATPDPSRANHRFVARTSAALYAMSAFATLVLAVPVWVLPPCL